MIKKTSLFMMAKYVLLLTMYMYIGGCSIYTQLKQPTGTVFVSTSPTHTNTTAITVSPILSATPLATITLSSRPTVTPRPTLTGQPIPSLTPTPIPTLDKGESRAYIIELLGTNAGCSLPCFLGITPGQSIITDTISMFSHIGWKGGFYYLDEVQKNYETGSGGIIENIEVLITLGVKDDVVDSMVIGLYGDKTLAIPYTIDSILSSYGIPSRVEVNLSVGSGYEVLEPQSTDYNLLIYYDQMGILAEYNGVATKYGPLYRLCPTQYFPQEPERENSMAAHLILKASENPNSLEEIAAYFGTSAGGYSLDNVTSMSIEEFYNQILQRNGNSFCIETPRVAWP